MKARASAALVVAVRKKDAKLVQRRLDEGADVNARGPDGHTALFDAIRLGSRAIVSMLLRAGADVSLDNEGHGPLWLASFKGDATTVKALLARRAPTDVNANPLEAAVGRGDVKVARLLLDAGAKAKGRFLLNAAARAGSVALIEALIDAGLRPELERKDANGWTPLLTAISARQWSAAEALLAAGAKLESRVGRAKPLALALERGGAAAVARLQALAKR